MDTDTFRRDLVAWLDANVDRLRSGEEGYGSLDRQLEQYRRVKGALHDAGWGRYGWPTEVGGLGGSPLLRAVVGEEMADRDLVDAGAWSMIEVLAPTVVAFGRPELVAEMLPPLLSGRELWCQGFSEPGAGSDLASLSCRAERVEGGWVVTGQKVWTSYVQFAQRCVLLARTGDAASRHRGITAFFVDVDSPGIAANPIETQNGEREFAEVFYDEVFVPDERVLGEVGGGWGVAMDILPHERSTTFWHRGAFLRNRTARLVSELSEAAAPPGPDRAAAAELGRAYQAVLAFRCRSRATQHRKAAGEPLGPETSIDKILIAAAEQRLFDAARTVLPGRIELATDPGGGDWRREFLHSRSATIYGGTAEIQRNIAARHLLDLGADR